MTGDARPAGDDARPGLANAVNGIADAAQERVPLLVISGVVERRSAAAIPTRSSTIRRCCARWSRRASRSSPKAPRDLVAGRSRSRWPRPWGRSISTSPTVAALRPAPRHRPHGGGVAAIARSIPPIRRSPTFAGCGGGAARLLLAGFEAARTGAAAALARLAEHGVPVLTTYKAKGLLDESHPLALGAAGLSPRPTDAARRWSPAPTWSCSPATTRSRCGRAGWTRSRRRRPSSS